MKKDINNKEKGNKLGTFLSTSEILLFSIFIVDKIEPAPNSQNLAGSR